MAARQFLNER